MPRVPLTELAQREYWRPGECARVLGRGAGFWSRLYDRGAVCGYLTEGGHRYIAAASARDYLAGLCGEGGGEVVGPTAADWAAFRGVTG